MSVTGGHPNTLRTVTQNEFSHTDSTTQPRVINEPLHSTGGSGGIVHPSSILIDLLSTRSSISPLLVKKTHELRKKSQASNAKVRYTFDVVKTEKILVKEKFITFP